MDLFNALSTTATARRIPPLKEAPPTKVMSCALVTSTDLDKDLDAVKEVTGGAGTPSAKMAGPPTMVCGHLAPRDEGRSPPVRQGSSCTQGRGTHLARALFPRPMIGKVHRSVTPTRPTTGILTTRKLTVQRQLVVPSSSSDDDLPLVKHDARVDLNPGGMRFFTFLPEPNIFHIATLVCVELC
jgi:hypothetical protein